MNKILIVILRVISIQICLVKTEDVLISKNRSPSLVKYQAFADATVMSFHIPENTIFASFKFVGSEQDLGIFGCNTRNVSVYLKQGSPPVINPDGSPFPKEFRNVTRSKTYSLEFQTDNKEVYINLTAPDPGAYYAAAFLAYEDPRYRKISQQGLTQNCNAVLDSCLFVRKTSTPTIVSENQLVDVMSQSNETRYFMFLVPDNMDHALLSVEGIKFATSLKQVSIRVQARKPATKESFLSQRTLNSSSPSLQFLFITEPLIWHYIEIDFQPISEDTEHVSELNFQLRFFLNRLPTEKFVSQTVGNVTLYNMSVVAKNYQTRRLTDLQPYTQYNLVRESTSKSFSFSYKLQPEMDYNMFVPINVTANQFSVLKFNLLQGTDIGGTLQYAMAFKPRVTKNKNIITFSDEPKENIVIGCIQKNSIAVPTWPKYCVSNDISMLSPIILNTTTDNSTVLIPYPESGTWYASFKLFCGACEPCECPDDCQQDYETCVINCELNCTDACQNCVESCRNSILSRNECSMCNCDGPCKKNSSKTCNSSIMFDTRSSPCYYGDCGRQGKCTLLISEGIAYSTCLCVNNYRGFDCSDGSQATPFSLVLLEFLLLVLSNIFFLPAAYVAFKREYYVETLAYTSVFISSSFYHACDAGENIISFCIFRLNALQFADFFSAMLAIWLTLLAMADLPSIHLSLLQMGGAIIIAFCVTLNRYAFWIFALPSCLGLLIILISWYLKYGKFRSRFIDRKYLYYKLPIGTVVVVVGLLIYGLLQTQNNYKYLHSLWHIIIATGVVFLLPKKDTFQASALL